MSGLDNRGKCVSISDHDELCKRWDDSLFLLRAKYEGEWVEKELQLLTDRVHNKRLLLNMMKRYYVFSEWLEADWLGIEFIEGKGYREHEETALGVPLLFSQECSIEDNEEGMSLHIVGNADLRKNEVQLEKISLLGEAQIENITSNRTTLYRKELIGLQKFPSPYIVITLLKDRRQNT